MRRKACRPDKIELVHKQVTPVPAMTLYQEAVSTGNFIGTFQDFLTSQKGDKGDKGDKGLDGVNGDGVWNIAEW